MTAYEFRLQSESDQIDLLYKEGTYIGKRKEGKASIVLYQLDAFYVEVFYHKYRRLVSRLHIFQSTQGLGPYLDAINLENLVKC
jgi:hypothetical protein